MFLRLTLLAVYLVCLSSWSEDDPKTNKHKKNVLLLAVDDLNDWTGFLNKHPQAITPHMDSLAERGTSFTNAHCQAPICGPSRASLFTGLYPHQTGIYGQYRMKEYDQYMKGKKEIVHLPHWFKNSGYRTIAVGKIMHGSAASYFDTDHGRFEGFGPKPKKRFAYDPSWFPEKFGGTQTDWGAYPDMDSKMPDYKIANVAISELSQPHEEPFFLAVGFMRPHVPWYVPQKWLEKFPVDSIQLPPWKEDDLDDVPDAGISVNLTPQMPTTKWAQSTKQWSHAIRAYLASVNFVDHQIGRVIKALKASQYADNTIIVLFSDHGYHMGEKNRFSKHTLWDRSTRVPLIISGPGLPHNQQCHRAVELIDIYPTLLDLCQLQPNETNQGQSLIPLLNTPDSHWPFTALTAYGRGNYSVKNDRFRLTRYFDGSMELYDHQNDPNEWNNLAGISQYKEIIDDLISSIPKQDARWATPSDHNVNEHFLKYQRSEGVR